MMIMDIFELLVKFADHMLSQPDEHIEYFDSELKDLFTNKEFVEQLKSIMYPNQDTLRIPNSEAQKKLKQYLIFCNQILEYEKYLDDKAANAREERRSLLIAMAIYDATLSHEASVSDFWNTLSDQYIQYLQDRLMIIQLQNQLAPLYARESALTKQIDNLQSQIKKLDGEIARTDAQIERRMDELLNISQSRLNAVSQVAHDSISNHLEVLQAGSTNLSALVVAKEVQLKNAVHHFEAYEHTNPQDKSSTAYTTHKDTIAVAEKELAQANDAVSRFVDYANQLHTERQNLNTTFSQLTQQAQNARGYQQKNIIDEKINAVIANMTPLVSNKKITSLIADVDRRVQDIPGADSNFSQNMFTQLKDMSLSFNNARNLRKDEAGYKREKIDKLINNKDTIVQKREEITVQLEKATNERENIRSQISQFESRMREIDPHFVSSALQTVPHRNPSNTKPPSIPPPPNNIQIRP